MTDLIIQGINGRMGHTLVEKISARSDCRIVAGVDQKAGQIGDIPVYASLEDLPEAKGIVIDFTSPAGTVHAAQFCAAHGMPCVLCSTGLSKEDEAVVEQASEKVPVFRSANMSVGINVLIELARRATKLFDGEFDIEIVEKHHHNKLDAPSGTALMIANAINEEAAANMSMSMTATLCARSAARRNWASAPCAAAALWATMMCCSAARKRL